MILWRLVPFSLPILGFLAVRSGDPLGVLVPGLWILGGNLVFFWFVLHKGARGL